VKEVQTSLFLSSTLTRTASDILHSHELANYLSLFGSWLVVGQFLKEQSADTYIEFSLPHKMANLGIKNRGGHFARSMVLPQVALPSVQ